MKRNASKRFVAGVCSGIAGEKTLFLWVLRVAFLVPFIGTLGYVILAFVLKDENGKRLKFFELVDAVSGHFLANLENRFHFPVSRLTWHFVTSVAVATIVGGILVLLYSFTPVFTESVPEPTYLEQRDVDASDVLKCSNSGTPKASQQIRKRKKQETDNSASEEDVRDIPQVSLERLQASLPNTKFSQKGRKMVCDRSEGYYEYGDWGDWVYPSRCYEYGDIDTKAALEIRGALQAWFPYDSATQQYTIDKLAEHLNFYQVASRPQIYRGSLNWINRTEKMGELWELWTAIDKVIGNVAMPSLTITPEKLFSEMDNFMAKNKTGEPILRKALELIAITGGSDRLAMFKVARANYRDFGLDKELWMNATDKFLSMKDLHVQTLILKNLQCFYNLYIDEIASREQENQRLKQEYENAKFEAEATAKAKEVAQVALRIPATKVIGIAFVVILLISIILALFSMQRLISRIESVLDEIKEKK